MDYKEINTLMAKCIRERNKPYTKSEEFRKALINAEEALRNLKAFCKLDTEDREKRYEEAVLLDGSVIKIYAPYIDAAYFDREKNVYCLEYDNRRFICSEHQSIWKEV